MCQCCNNTQVCMQSCTHARSPTCIYTQATPIVVTMVTLVWPCKMKRQMTRAWRHRHATVSLLTQQSLLNCTTVIN